MKVKTLRKHDNPHPPCFEKNVGRVYDLPDLEAEALISAGLVERYSPTKKKAKADAPKGQDKRVSRTRPGARGASQGGGEGGSEKSGETGAGTDGGARGGAGT